MNLKPGDLIFVHDTNIWNMVSNVIMICETDKLRGKGKVPYHVALVCDQHYLIEATWGGGVRLMPIDHYLRKSFLVWYKRLKEGVIPAEQLQVWARQHIGKPYDKWQIFGIAWRSVLRIIPPIYYWLKKHTSLVDSKKKFICSEFVMKAYLDLADINLYPTASLSNITPHDLNRSPLLVEIV